MKHVGKKIQVGIMALALVCGAAGNGFPDAQDDQEIAGVVATMQQMLQLTPTQIREVASVIREYFRNVAEAKADGITGTDLQRKIKDLHNEMDSSLEDYLSEDQMRTWLKQTSAKPSEDTSQKPARKNRVLSAGLGSQATVNTRAQEDNDGVLQSGGNRTANTTKTADTTRTSGVW